MRCKERRHGFPPAQVHSMVVKLAHGGLEVNRPEREKQKVIPAEDGIFADSAALEHLQHLRPNLAVGLFIGFGCALAQPKNKGKPLHRLAFGKILFGIHHFQLTTVTAKG